MDEKHHSKSELGLPLPTATVSKTAPSRHSWVPPLLIALAVVGAVVQFTGLRTPSQHYHHGAGSVHQARRESWRERRAVDGYWRSLISQASGHHSCQRKEKLDVEKHFLTVPSAESARRASHSFTAVAHIAGTEADRISALRVKSQWEELLGAPSTGEGAVYEAGSKESRRALMGGCFHHGKRSGKWKKTKRWARELLGARKPWARHQKPRVWVDTYYPLLNYPVSHSLTLTPPGVSEPSFVAKLSEDIIAEDPTSAKGPPTFHGFSKNGTARGQLVYVGRGTKEEFDSMVAEGFDFTGKIVIAQYSGSFRGLKVQQAARVGAVGCLIYSDPAADGNTTVEAGLAPYPQGPARQPSSVQRGSVQFLSIYPGDPLTPNKPAYKDAERLPEDSEDLNIPSIPSIPISYEDAIPLLKSLKGRGVLREDKLGFREGGLGYRGVEYWTGPSEDVVELSNIMDNKVTPIWNSYAVIPGHLRDEIVVLGNHNDAWTFGAGDPNSGTAAVHEVVKGFGELLKEGWKPLRTILIASWDAEEYGLIGSTEFGEDYSQWLKERVVAYINVDVAVAGSDYDIKASPSLADLFKDVSALIPNPDKANRTLNDPENELHIGSLGSGSDFSVFLQYIGLASSNVGYTLKQGDPIYHYHSNYDSAYWMDHFGDPTFDRHAAVAKVLGLASIRLADSPVLPINVTAYAHALDNYARKIPALAEDLKPALDLEPLDKVIAEIKSAAASIDDQIKDIRDRLDHLFMGRPHPHHHLINRLRKINKKLQSFESTFIDEEGLTLRPWYRSLVVAPGRDLGYGATTFPGVTEALALDRNTTAAAAEVKRLVRALNKTVQLLRDG